MAQHGRTVHNTANTAWFSSAPGTTFSPSFGVDALTSGAPALACDVVEQTSTRIVFNCIDFQETVLDLTCNGARRGSVDTLADVYALIAEIAAQVLADYTVCDTADKQECIDKIVGFVQDHVATLP